MINREDLEISLFPSPIKQDGNIILENQHECIVINGVPVESCPNE